MTGNSAKPKDLTGSLVHIHRKGHANQDVRQEGAERRMAMDPFALIVWLMLGLTISVQLTLLIWLDVI